MADQGIEACKQDIAALEHEILQLEEDKHRLSTLISETTHSQQLLHSLLSKYSDEFTELNKKREVRDEIKETLFSTPKKSKKLKTGTDSRNNKHIIPEYLPPDIFDPSINSLLDTEILYSPSKNIIVTQDNHKLMDLGCGQEEIEKLTKYTDLETSYRLLFGVTSFPLGNPRATERNLHSNNELLGLRFDIYDEHLRIFKKPYYILFGNDNTSHTTWKIINHTIPMDVVEDLEYVLYHDFYTLTSMDDVYLFGKLIHKILTLWVARYNYLMKFFKENRVSNYKFDQGVRVIEFTYNGNNILLEVDKYDMIIDSSLNFYEYFRERFSRDGL